MTRSQQTVLVVDDEQSMRKFLTHSLRASGYNVLTAADGAEALKTASEQCLDLILLDISLPGPDGLTILEAVRRDMQVPVVMISACARATDRITAFDRGADGYLTKPFGVTELLARVRAVLRRAPRTGELIAIPRTPASGQVQVGMGGPFRAC